jgi:hypothetical protein
MKKIQIHLAGFPANVELATIEVSKAVREIRSMNICEVAYGEITLHEGYPVGEKPHKAKAYKSRR